MEISIHAPRTGSDRTYEVKPELDHYISIHAPRTGSDQFSSPPNLSMRCYFNPRSPHGERLLAEIIRPCNGDFNPRSPHGERRRNAVHDKSDEFISIHAPRTGSDGQPHGANAPKFGISIHAPRTGSDVRLSVMTAGVSLFQSTLPARGATDVVQLKVVYRRISIHAPRTGSDSAQRQGAPICAHFNPRSPHGERQRKVTILSIRIIGFAQKVYHKTVLLRISLAENAVILPEKPRNPVRTSLQKAGGLRFARAIRAARPYSISSPSGA